MESCHNWSHVEQVFWIASRTTNRKWIHSSKPHNKEIPRPSYLLEKKFQTCFINLSIFLKIPPISRKGNLPQFVFFHCHFQLRWHKIRKWQTSSHMNSRFKIPTEVFTSEAQYDVIPALGRLRQKDHMIGTSKAKRWVQCYPRPPS